MKTFEETKKAIAKVIYFDSNSPENFIGSNFLKDSVGTKTLRRFLGGPIRPIKQPEKAFMDKTRFGARANSIYAEKMLFEKVTVVQFRMFYPHIIKQEYGNVVCKNGHTLGNVVRALIELRREYKSGSREATSESERLKLDECALKTKYLNCMLFSVICSLDIPGTECAERHVPTIGRKLIKLLAQRYIRYGYTPIMVDTDMLVLTETDREIIEIGNTMASSTPLMYEELDNFMPLGECKGISGIQRHLIQGPYSVYNRWGKNRRGHTLDRRILILNSIEVQINEIA
ncbi:hypothetical protein [Vibrio phage VP-1]|uniref:Uncharacterized protein n=1 Tax=Vibrio phage VP-1 TaxID=2234088 RepID=A0A4P2TH67_9CAUD|nr:hypothetical protein [Vibrio phage VP-1]